MLLPSRSFFFLGIFTILLFSSCSLSQSFCPIIDLDNPDGSIELKLSDLLDNIRVIPLETKDDMMFSTESTFFCITNDYILADTNGKLLQFNHQGNYIRTLAVKGNGPNEFTMILNILPDEKGEILYYTDYRNNESVLGINLHTGAFLKFSNPELDSFSISAVDREGNIYGTTSPNVMILDAPAQKSTDNPALAFSYKPDQEGNTVMIEGSHSFVIDHRVPSMFRQGDHICLFHPSYSDTLFILNGNKIFPQYVIKFRNPRIDAFKGGVILSFLVSGNWGSIIGRQELKGLSEMRNPAEHSQRLPYLYLDNKAALKTITSITFDSIGLTLDMDSFPIMSSNLWGFYALEAYEMTDLIDQALIDNQHTVDQRKKLEEIAAKINNDSNPVLIMGRIR